MGKLENRLDLQRRSDGALVFDDDEAAEQKKLFREIRAGDLVILKTADIRISINFAAEDYAT